MVGWGEVPFHFIGAAVTTATAEDRYQPAGLTRRCARVRPSGGFNTAHIVPPALADVHDHSFDGIDTERIYLPDVVDDLVERYPKRLRSAIDGGHLELRSCDEFRYGVAQFAD